MNDKHHNKNASFEKIFQNFKMRDLRQRDDPDVISLEAVQLIASNSKLQVGTMLTLQFDAMLRPEELLNIRKKDITWDEKQQGYYVYIEHPKAQSYKRTLSLPYCTDWLRKYLSLHEVQNLKPEELIFNISYGCYRVTLRNLAKKTIGRYITPYTLRHSGIQHWVTLFKGDVTKICKRAGWDFSTKMLQTYLNRSKVNDDISPEVTHKDKLEEMQDTIKNLQEQLQQQQQQNVAYENSTLKQVVQSSWFKKAMKDAIKSGQFNE